MDKKRKIVVINFSFHIYQQELLQFLHFDNLELSTKLFDFATTLSNPSTFQKYLL